LHNSGSFWAQKGFSRKSKEFPRKKIIGKVDTINKEIWKEELSIELKVGDNGQCVQPDCQTRGIMVETLKNFSMDDTRTSL